jgi:GNAT superfamily N-acetyltransferase
MTLSVSAEDPTGADALALVAELSATLAALTGASGQASFDVADVLGPRACFALARDAHGRALGCGALRPLAHDIAEVKRMFARPGTRGVGSAVLRFLEAEAARWGYAVLRLSTRRVNERAVAFYERHGYRRIAGYGRYAGSDVSVCFEKWLGPVQTNEASA